MTPEELQHLIAAGETMNVEFKGEEREPLSDRDAAELCQLSPDQAYRLLTRLTKEAKLKRHGTKKRSLV